MCQGIAVGLVGSAGVQSSCHLLAGKGLLGDGLLKTGTRCTFSGFVLKRHHCLNKAVACAQSQIR